MNTITRMVLIPEDQYNKKCKRSSKLFDINPIMKSDLPQDQKVRLLNELHELMLKKTTLKKAEPLEKQLRPIISSNLSSNMKIKLLERVLEKKSIAEKEEPKEEQTYIYENEESDESGDFSTPLNTSLAETSIQTPKITALLPQIDTDEITRRITRYQNSKEMLQKEKDSMVSALLSLPELFNKDGKVIKDNGDIYLSSNIRNIVDYMFNETGVLPTPRGLPRVLSVIKEKKPELMSRIRNPNYSTLPSWRQLNARYSKLTYRQKTPEASEESEDSTKE